MKKDKIPHLQEQIDALNKMTDDDIDYSDIPPVTDFSGFERGKFYRPEKESVTLRLDSDILAWFKQHSSEYAAEINSVLRHYIQAQN